MAKKKSEKAFIKEIKNELTSYFVKDFKEVTIELAKKYELSIDQSYLDKLLLSKEKDIPLDGMKISDLLQYSKDYPNAIIHVNYAYPQYHLKSVDELSIRIYNQSYTEDDSEELAEKIANWLYSYYSLIETTE